METSVYQLPEGSEVSYGFRIKYKSLPKGAKMDEVVEFAVAQTKRLESAAANLSGREVEFTSHIISKKRTFVEVFVKGVLGGYVAK